MLLRVLNGLLLAWTFASVAHADTEPPPDGWIIYPTPKAGACEWTRANWSHREWRVRLDGERLVIEPWAHLPQRTDTPKFAIPMGENAGRGGPCENCVTRTDDGWLVGFNFGEWGGYLWWTDADGRAAYPINVTARCADLQEAQVQSSDASNAIGGRISNVVQVDRAGDQRVYVFSGLAHLGMRSGTVTRVERHDGKWQACLVHDMHAEPEAVVRDSASSWLVLTSARGDFSEPRGGALLRVAADGKVQELAQPAFVATGGLYPNSMVKTSNGTLYVGMRHFVGRLTPGGQDGYRDELLLPKDRPPFDFEPAIDGPNPIASCSR